MLNWLQGTPVLNAIFLVLATASIVVSVLLYFRSKKEKRPWLAYKTIKLVEDQISSVEGVEILYNGKPVQSLTLTRIALWNAGREPIESSDIAPSDALRLAPADNVQILAAEVAFQTVPANNFAVLLDPHTGAAIIAFDYFAQNEGVIVQLYHTGKTNDDVKLNGTIKGIHKISLYSSTRDPMTDAYLGTVLGPLPEPKQVPRTLRGPYVAVVIILLLPIAMILLPLDRLMRFVRRVPRSSPLQAL